MFDAILPFLEPINLADEKGSEGRKITIERNAEGNIIIAKTTKLLPNLRLNLKRAVEVVIKGETNIDADLTHATLATIFGACRGEPMCLSQRITVGFIHHFGLTHRSTPTIFGACRGEPMCSPQNPLQSVYF